MKSLTKVIRTDKPLEDIRRALLYQEEFPKNENFILPFHESLSDQNNEVLVEFVDLGISASNIVRSYPNLIPFVLTLVFSFMRERDLNAPKTYHPDFALHNIFINQDSLIIIDPFPPDGYSYLYPPVYDLLFEYLKLLLSYVENIRPPNLRVACSLWKHSLADSRLCVKKGLTNEKVAVVCFHTLFDELRFACLNRGLLSALKKIGKLAIFLCFYLAMNEKKLRD